MVSTPSCSNARGRKHGNRDGRRLNIGGAGPRGGHRHPLGQTEDTLNHEVERRALALHFDSVVCTARTL